MYGRGSSPSEQLRLNLSVPVAGQPNRLGVLGGDLQGFPNGRRLTDDVVDIELQALVGAAQTGKLVDALAAGDGVDANNTTFGDRFPYLALPNAVAVNTVGGAAPAPTPSDSLPTTDPTVDPTSSESVGAGIADLTQPGAIAGPASAESPDTWMTKPVAYASGATGLGALILAFGLFAFMRRRRRPRVVADPDQTQPM
ncbi:DUF4331 family protein [Paractinoplanes durhamensis]|uniref:DUF4331 family protein n=1 Tax=Paractinoplanes durhamensis TaxID=113563 RepID=UPI00363F6094